MSEFKNINEQKIIINNQYCTPNLNIKILKYLMKNHNYD